MYIDGVFSGGGVKGVALAGAYEALEEKGFRFARLAGTSAGAVIAAFIASGYSSKEIHALIEEADGESLLDQRYSFLPLKMLQWVSIYWRLGLFKGDMLEKWIADLLRVKGVRVFGDLKKGSLRLIASDLTNGTMIVLPDDLVRYGLNPDMFPVARAVRMSCSIPYFFEPIKLKTDTGIATVVDGGVLSNFPIWLFSKERKRPVIGVTLAPNERERPKKNIRNAFELFGALFETMKDAHDARHIASRYEQNIIFLPVDNVMATEFHLTQQKKLALIELGKSRTEQFLKHWTY
ncbi:MULTISPECIES: patatin-like phospholipase family protein [Bacillus]|uniref:Patatin-like phospholipase family protein n=1 Tax=Bacillus mojavensis TaxID=72360 RepID=A0AAP3CQ59_BACMO|nr:patatin-like phospholipase family protein [Bacillus mojavensis]MCY8104136.1 patatin-like phospholipase family protein [Bacillus mojavensis]MCY8480310.1 patatin-like phospholipase family protein [Bacillus mojavensis]MCY8509322.1 patatin-like phospholipase family protein [Bacillus mojavensis]MEC1625100.1 patatin-like phospholipase family protein [Bacillus mojavensis]MEC1776714.1 patatin-like phospholipase family protein [Bacillus mojavensis]